jgi:Kef-type K+ transport system membrane component KefB
MSFTGLWIVCLVALAAPLAATAAGRLRVPSVVLEVVAGILIGPAVLGWVHVDRTISVVSDIGLAMLLFMAGREIDYSRLRGPPFRLAKLIVVACRVHTNGSQPQRECQKICRFIAQTAHR